MKRGFTLFELLVVLVIVGLTSVLVVPRLTGSMTSVNLKSAAKKTAAALRYARDRSASSGEPWVADFDFDKRRLSVSPYVEKTEEKPEDEVTDGEKKKEAGKVYDFPESVVLEKAVLGEKEIDTEVFQVFFFPNGSTSGGDIVLSNGRGKRYGINVDFVTGVVRIAVLETRK